jgi:hypothetical protein
MADNPQGSRTETVSIFGTVQQYLSVGSTITQDLIASLVDVSKKSKNDSITFVDGQTRETMNLNDAIAKARHLKLAERLRVIPETDVVVIRIPSSLAGFVVVLASLLTTCPICLLPWELTDTTEICRVLRVLRATVYVTTKQGLWEVDYDLCRLRIRCASIGNGSEPLRDGTVDLTARIDPATIESYSMVCDETSLEATCLYFYDAQTKQLFDFTQRGIKALVSDCIQPTRLYWKEIIISKLTSFSLLGDILPRVLSSIGAGKLEPVTICFDTFNVERISLRKLKGPTRSFTVKAARQVLPDIASIMLVAGCSALADYETNKRYTTLGVMGDKDILYHRQHARAGHTGKLVVSGPSVFRQSMGSVKNTVESFLLCSTSEKLWVVFSDVEIIIEDDGQSLKWSGTLLPSNDLGKSADGKIDGMTAKLPGRQRLTVHHHQMGVDPSGL